MTRPSLILAAALALSCTGVISGEGGEGGPRPGTGGGDALDDDQGAIDDDLQAENPELFEIALRYFPGTDVAAPKKRLFRLSRTQLDLTSQSLLPQQGGVSAFETLPRDPLEKNYEYAANMSFSAANFTPFANWVKSRAEAVLAQPASVIDCVETDAACLSEQARLFVSRAFRGVVSDEQLARFDDFFTASVAQVGLAQATADLVDVTLSSPSFVFRDEVQTADDDLLLPAQLTQHLSYTLADAPPEAMGLDLLGPDDVAAAVDQVLATPLARDKLLRFFNAWLEVKEPDEFEIATSVFPEFTPELAAAIVAETEAFLERQLGAAVPKLTDLTQAPQSFLSEPLASMYGSDLDQRIGIFSQPAVIASHSGPTTTRLVKRGVFFTRKVMCLPLGVPPEGVDTTIPEELEGTERQRIESVTMQSSCAGCHAYINPFGFMQENFDAIGRYRTLDNGLPVDASISVDFLDEGPLATSTAVEALSAFTSSLRFQQCFTRQLFRFYMGRDEEPGDDQMLRQMFFTFANGGQDIVKLLQVLAGSSTFARRSETP